MSSTTVFLVFVAVFVPVLALHVAWIKGMRMPNWLAGVLIAILLFGPPVPLAVLLVASLFRQSWAAQWPFEPVLKTSLALVTVLWIGGALTVERWIWKCREKGSR